MPPTAIKETALRDYVIPDEEVQQIKPPVSENILEPETMEREPPIRELRRSTRDRRPHNAMENLSPTERTSFLISFFFRLKKKKKKKDLYSIYHYITVRY